MSVWRPFWEDAIPDKKGTDIKGLTMSYFPRQTQSHQFNASCDLRVIRRNKSNGWQCIGIELLWSVSVGPHTHGQHRLRAVSLSCNTGAAHGYPTSICVTGSSSVRNKRKGLTAVTWPDHRGSSRTAMFHSRQTQAIAVTNYIHVFVRRQEAGYTPKWRIGIIE